MWPFRDIAEGKYVEMKSGHVVVIVTCHEDVQCSMLLITTCVCDSGGKEVDRC